MNLDEQVMITLLDKGLLALVVVVAVFGLNSLLEMQKARAGLEQELASQRAEVYGELWSKTQTLGFANRQHLPPDLRESLFQELTTWYYEKKGAMYLSHAATKKFLFARKQLQDDVSDEAIRDSFSALRTQLKRDSGIYTWLDAKRRVVP